MTSQVRDLAPSDVLALLEAGARLIDVREADEHVLGAPAGAVPVPRAQLESSPESFHPDLAAPVVLICGSGRRSRLAGETLVARGYSEVYSVLGGFDRWQSERLPMMRAEGDEDFHERYARHLRLPQVGIAGQRRLEASTVLLVGAGGLGSPVAYYLAAAGVGCLRLVDDDRVDRSNLQRQILHTEARVGELKVDSAADALSALNPRVRMDARAERVTLANVDSLLADVDVVVDGADNFPTRYLLSDACVRLGKPLVYGAVHRFEGQVSVFDAGRHRGEAPCYRCLFPEPPTADEAPNCSEAGVLGVLPGIIGLLQANEVIKLLLDIGEPLRGRLLHFDALSGRFRETRLRPDPDCAACGPGRRLREDAADPGCAAA